MGCWHLYERRMNIRRQARNHVRAIERLG